MQRKPDRIAASEFDVLVIGGGIYGVCVAWDAALRGLSVALLEKGDFGHATSSNSLRIIHGGLRSLQHGDIRRMRRLMHERAVFMRIAPHLVHPMPFLIPTYGRFLRSKEVFNLAFLANDLVGLGLEHPEDSQKHLPRGRVISREECLRMIPGLETRDLTGAAIIYDSQMSSSERLVIAFARSAAAAGVEMANYVEVTGFLGERGRVAGVKARDLLKGDDFSIRARVVVNTSGPWLDRVVNLLNGYSSSRRQALSKAFNIQVDRQWLPGYAVGVYCKNRFTDRDAVLNKGSRLFFITPWHKGSMIGTAHLPYDADPDSFRVTEDEIHAFLDEVNEAYPAACLKRHDVSFVYGGLVPMADNGSGSNDVRLMKQCRIHDHQKDEGLSGLISVSGVKFTEARHVAEIVVNLVFKKLGRTPPKSRTAFAPVHGGRIEHFDSYLAGEMRRNELPPDIIRNLIYHYGSAHRDVLKYLGRSESKNSNTEASRVMKAEVLHGIREEMAQKLADVVFRRTSLRSAGKPGDSSLQVCAAVMSEELGWNEARAREEIGEVNALYRD